MTMMSKEFIRTHLEVLVATDFFTAEVWTLSGLVTYYVLSFIHLGSRQVHVAGVTPHPTAPWMVQAARNMTMARWGFLGPGQYLIPDRDDKVCPALQRLIDAAGVKRVPLPPRSPHLNAYAECWVRSVQDVALLRLFLFGEVSLRHALHVDIDAKDVGRVFGLQLRVADGKLHVDLDHVSHEEPVSRGDTKRRRDR